MTDFIEPTHSLLLNGYSKRIQDLLQSTKNYALKNEKIHVFKNFLFFLQSLTLYLSK